MVRILLPLSLAIVALALNTITFASGDYTVILWLVIALSSTSCIVGTVNILQHRSMLIRIINAIIIAGCVLLLVDSMGRIW